MTRSDKTLLTVLGIWFGILAVFSLLIYILQPYIKNNPKYKENVVCALDQSYYEYNQDYFFGQLPEKVNVVWADMTDSDLHGDMGKEWTDAETGIVEIRIDRKTNPVGRQARLTLLHELCHVKLTGKEFDFHGQRFQECMVDLAAHGAFHDLW